MRHFSILVLILVLFVGAASSQNSQLPVERIIDQMISVYASCDSYVDEGEVVTIFIKENGNRTVIKPFSTAFVRPSNFRFEYKDRRGENEWNSYIIWKEADLIKTWWSIQPTVKNPENLNLATAAAAGVSSLSSVTIPNLLISELHNYNRFKTLKDLKLVGEETVNGNLAYKIEATQADKNPITLWIDKNNSLLVKTFQTRKFEDQTKKAEDPTKKFETATTTTYKSQINIRVPEDKLAFNAPEIAK